VGPLSPYLVVDTERLERNIARVAGHARDAGVDLRPHVKTHKSVEIARRQLAAGAVGVTVATVGEAEVFVEAGVTDVLVAYPLWLTDDAAARVRRLADRATVTIGVDSPTGAARAAELLAGTGVRLVVEVDSGHHRTGVPPEAAGTVARVVRGALPVVGAFTFPGHSYAPGAGPAVAAQESAALVAAAESLREHGVTPAVLSAGSTPSLADADTAVATELRPGVYVFGDAQQLELGRCAPEDIALTVAATVVSHHAVEPGTPPRFIIDAGSKILGSDKPAWATGYGRLLDHPDARITALSEHHATVEWHSAEGPPALGERLRAIPNHVCLAMNLVDDVAVGSNGSLVERWRVAARGKNS
jgi:D-serine deaminase-like pyridoxal phosphate-dependent protein